MKKIRDWITEHPESYNQDLWGSQTECGTKHCIAGWACVLSGVQLSWYYAYDDDVSYTFMTKDGAHISTVARDLLGLSSDQAEKLFCTGEEDSLYFLNKWIGSH